MKTPTGGAPPPNAWNEQPRLPAAARLERAAEARDVEGVVADRAGDEEPVPAAQEVDGRGDAVVQERAQTPDRGGHAPLGGPRRRRQGGGKHPGGDQRRGAGGGARG